MAGMTMLRSCCERMEQQVREQAGLTEAQCWLLTCMPADEPVSTGQVCVDAGLSPSRGGRIVEELVKSGLLARRPDPADRRVARVGLTERGRAIKRQVDEMLQACEAEVVSRLAPTELATVETGLALLLRALDAGEEPPR